jgi:Flp pilus assembly protein TadG
VRHRVRRTPAQALVEMAFVLPLLIILLAVVIEFGWLYLQLYYLNSATRLAARLGASQATANNGAILTAVDNARGPVVLSATPTITVSSAALAAQPDTNRSVGNILTVYARANYQTFTGLVNLRQFANITELRSRSTFMIKP